MIRGYSIVQPCCTSSQDIYQNTTLEMFGLPVIMPLSYKGNIMSGFLPFALHFFSPYFVEVNAATRDIICHVSYQRDIKSIFPTLS